ncbi:proton-coupled amino acid transporter-like protein pathetic isoform X1 [Nasonia vitripennis]|uniref:Amino acid transporter transmembrane domain-containing protein n=2 Tax=Nasonia vitripennis TaxID=7425 RepID=A0A7M7HAI3_NASVI|nr:proton-coupled amino acid transporter-like protein pathetic isoform X1 [Nasonia vitripennis]
MQKFEGDTRNAQTGTDDYDPEEHRPPEQLTTGTFAVFMHLIKAAIGSGILFLPYAFRRTGYLAAILCSIFIGTISIHTAVITVQCCQILCKRSHVPSLNFAETAEASFKLGPEPFRKYAGAFALATNVIVCFVQYETAVVYSIYVASSFQQVFEYLSGWNHQDVRIYLLVFLPIFCALSLIPNFKYLVPFTIIGSICLLLGFCTTLYYMIDQFPSPSRLEMYTDIEHLAIYCSVFLFAVHNMSMLMPLENTMRHPRRMGLVLGVSMIVNVIVNVTFGFLGYNKYQNACDTVIKNLPLDELPAQMVKVAVSLSVLLTYGLQYYVPITILWPMIAKRIGNKRVYETFFRLGGVIACTSLAIALPHLAQLLGLFAALSMTTVMLLIPAMIEITTKWNDPGRARHYLMLVKNVFILFVWLMIMVFGTIENIRDILREYSGAEDPDAAICG